MLLDLLHICRGHVLRGGKGNKQVFGHLIDPLVGALGRQAPHHQQTPGVVSPLQGAGSIGVEVFEGSYDELRPLFFLL